MSKTVKILLAVAVLAAAGAIFYQKVYLPKSTYETYQPKKGSTSVSVFGIGELSAERIYGVGTPTGGKILSVETDQGKWIKKGDLIAQIDPVDLQSRIRGATASLKRAELDLQAANQEYKVALTQAALAQSSYDKDLEVYRAKGISSLAYEKSKTEMLTARTQAEIAKSKIASAKTRLTEVNETIKGLQQRLEQMTITSPIDGFVIERNAEPGQSVPPAFTLVKIVDPKTLWAKAWIDERISGKVKVGQRAAITLRSREDAPLEGVVRRIAAVSDPVTEEREVDVGFAKIPKPFYINEQVEVLISIETFDGLYKVPLHLVVQYKGEKGVWIDQGGKAHFVKLSIVAEDGKYAGVDKGVTEKTKILVPDSKKKPLFEGSSISS